MQIVHLLTLATILWLASRLTNCVRRIISIRLTSCRNILVMLFTKYPMGPWLSPLLTRKRKKHRFRFLMS